MAEYISRTSILWALRLAKNCAIEQVVQESGEYDKMLQTGKACYDGIVAAFDICIKVVESMIDDVGAVEAADVQWISVKERQPDKDDLYLVAVENEICVYMDIADYSNNQWHKHDEVIYWQPLPELPKEG